MIAVVIAVLVALSQPTTGSAGIGVAEGPRPPRQPVVLPKQAPVSGPPPGVDARFWRPVVNPPNAPKAPPGRVGRSDDRLGTGGAAS